MTHQYLTVEEVAEYLRLHEETVRRMTREGTLPGRKVGRSWRYTKRELDAWVANQTDGNGTPYIICVDDDEDVLRYLRVVLEQHGCKTATTTRGRHGIQLANERTPNLVIIDLLMPEMDGAEVLRELRSRSPALPVIILTGHPDSKLLEQALPYSPFVLLAKPITPTKLMQTVHRQLGLATSQEG